jgi:hypothetical protein
VKLLALIKPAITVLYHGKSLTKAETWKNAQAITNLMIAVAAIVTAFVPGLEIPPDMISNIAIAIAGAANWYFTLATSEKVGLPPIEFVAEPGMESHYVSKAEEPTAPVDYVHDVPAYVYPDDPRWLRKHPVPTRPESEFESDGSRGFNDK